MPRMRLQLAIEVLERGNNMLHDIKVVMTHEEAIELFHKTCDNGPRNNPWTGVDETGRPETEIQWAYGWLGCGRTSWGVAWADVSDRVRGLLRKLLAQYGKNEYGPKGDLIFSAQKEENPPLFYIILY